MIMAWFGYDPTLTPLEQPIGVIWTLKIAFGLIPAIFTCVGLFVLMTYHFKEPEQVDGLQKALDLHRQGLPARDPIWKHSIVQVTKFLEETDEIQYGDRVISKENSTILQHFFPGELNSVLEAEDIGVLQSRQICTVIAGLIMLPIGIV